MGTTKINTLAPKNILDFIFTEERRSSLMLVVAILLALIAANSSFKDSYFAFFNTKIDLGPLSLDVKHWISEGLMALFFLVVGLEIKRELIDGELKTWHRAAFPVVAAIGGMVVPGLIFSSLNPYLPESRGWAIPMATDIALAAGVIGLLGKRLPKNLRLFLLTLAIVDDIGSIIAISLFYNQPTNMLALSAAFILVLGLAIARRQRYWLTGFLVLGLSLWFCLLASGVSATIAGVVVAFLMPLSLSNQKSKRLQTSEIIEDLLIPITSFIIVPLFVLANAGIDFSKTSLESSANLSVFLGVFLGLFIGKPLGIMTAAWLGNTLNIAHKPPNVSWSQLLGVSFIAGIGFTISILISGLAYKESSLYQNTAIVGIFSASLLSALTGLTILLRRTSPK